MTAATEAKATVTAATIVDPIPVVHVSPQSNADVADTPHVERYGLFEINLDGTSDGNPYVDVELTADFISATTGETVAVGGFYRGNGRYSIRFMPIEEGEWRYVTHSTDSALNAITGKLIADPAGDNNHGRVLRATDAHRAGISEADPAGDELRFQFSYEDGTRYLPFGTTCYAWTSQSQGVQDETVATLAAAPFNKIRMCVFPKFYDFNNADPDVFAYEGDMDHGFDHTRFNEKLFANLDRRIGQLCALGIEADIILLHPYDKEQWGFSKMSREDDIRYLTYMARRYSAYRNVWWSLANEYDLMPQKSLEDWRTYARVVMTNDAFDHLRSIHNCVTVYDYNEPWCTHCSIQRVDVTRTTECIADWREAYGKPVVCDEPGYEGNIYWGWGSLPATELMRRYWEGLMRCGTVTHGETFIDKGDQIWWAHGGKLHGEAPERIAFMRRVFEAAPRAASPLGANTDPSAVWSVNPVDASQPLNGAMEKAMKFWDVPVLRAGTDWQLVYFGWYQQLYREFDLPAGGEYTVDVIDTWNMTVERMPGTYTGTVRADLGGRQYMAVRIQRV
ncbi:alpha-L-rhamnosidase [Bifidobacterium tissieri]|uniref:Alpha-L-rhamnosidase n=1 Tax=Bifidobacterium tissieri TaxID=1630162 RepID=A0A261FBY5_9BIFI|nr:DUF5605 domain-containing protein [Bifidobacterium tissieri]OZG56555.1 alpha-L-rhamnosidase [Bifidobacterium tissieri]